MSFDKYFWESRLSTYYSKVLPIPRTRVRKLINRCYKVDWEQMDEVNNLIWFEVKDYLRNHPDLLEKLWKLEFGTSIHS